jgi:alkanesulfonate monooxygenase SsuD/methylene tetrahydromethanopterin reductase-like flavin-dependent oxidoreductase (luciferase family)
MCSAASGARALAVCVIVGIAAGCAGPSRTDDDYRHKVANTAETMQGLIGTVQVALEAAARDRVPGPYLSVTLAETDDDASATVDTFDSVQPPSKTADQLRNKLDTLMQQTTSAMDDLRITVRRGDIGALPGLAKPLDKLNGEFEELAGIA